MVGSAKAQPGIFQYVTFSIIYMRAMQYVHALGEAGRERDALRGREREREIVKDRKRVERKPRARSEPPGQGPKKKTMSPQWAKGCRPSPTRGGWWAKKSYLEVANRGTTAQADAEVEMKDGGEEDGPGLAPLRRTTS